MKIPSLLEEVPTSLRVPVCMMVIALVVQAVALVALIGAKIFVLLH